LCEGLLALLGAYYLRHQSDVAKIVVPRGDEVRILTIGESTTAGVPGPPEQAYPHRLQQILSARSPEAGPFRVFNMGTPGVTSDFIAARLPEYLDQFRPHIVIGMLGVNDGPAADPTFQVDGSWRIAKLLRLVWSRLGPEETEQTMEDALEARLLNASVASVQLAALMDSETFDSRVESARLHLLIGQPELAAERARSALRLSPNHPEPTALLAEARRRLGHVEDAERLFRAALAADPASADANWGLFSLKFEANPAVAQRHLRTFVGQWPEDPRVGQSYLRLVRWVALLPPPSTERGPTIDGDRLGGATRATPDELLVDGFYRLRESGTAAAIPVFERAWTDDALRFMSRASYYTLISELLSNGRADDGARLLEVALRSRHTDDRASSLCVAFEQIIEPRRPIDGCGEDEQRSERRLLNSRTARNYHRIRELTEGSGAVLVAMQYPMRPTAPLERLFAANDEVVRVDNELPFRTALTQRPSNEIFSDLFAGDFGHMTAEGHRLLASNAADTLLAEVIPRLKGSESP